MSKDKGDKVNNRILEMLEFEKVKQSIQEFIMTAQGEEELMKLVPVSDQEQIKNWLEETEDGLKVQRLCGGFPIPKLENILPHMKRIKIGADLNGVELAQVSRVLSTTNELHQFIGDLADDKIEFFRLYMWAEQLVTIPSLSRRLKEAIDEDGRVTDNVSSELKMIRQNIAKSEQQVKEQLDEIIRGKNIKYLSDTIITMRNDCHVIPVKKEYREIFGGIVHDQSVSGQTLFVEPQQIVELNSRLRQYQIDERIEVQRILCELSAELAPYRKTIIHNAFVVGKFDLINAKAHFGKSLQAIVPKISEQKYVILKQARHPLIDQEKVVANDIIFGKNYQSIVITGPNTGGKTIALKTFGILQLMGQAGLPIPVGEDSQIGVFEEIFADIGDEQSIEQNLSTFSSHMTNIVNILSKVNENSLVLLDELGSGTDPQEGAALAIAILDYLEKKSAYVIATTHYPELKIYGYNRSNTINASMEFDADMLIPTYRLLIGVPGRSNAFEISSRLGLDKQVINEAKQWMSAKRQDLNKVIADLENSRRIAENEYLEMRHYVDKAQVLYDNLNEAYSYFLEEREKEMEQAAKKANELVFETEKKAEKIIADIRKMQQQVGYMSVKEHQLIDAKTQLSNLYQDEKIKKNKVLKKAKEQKILNPGDEVLVTTYNQRGTLLRKKGNEWQVEVGILKINVLESELIPVNSSKEPTKHVMHTVRSEVASHVPNKLDIRGKRYEEALSKVDQYLDAVILAGYPKVTIVHGKGTGILRDGVIDYLKKHQNVKSFEFASANQGGNGATVIQFK